MNINNNIVSTIYMCSVLSVVAVVILFVFERNKGFKLKNCNYRIREHNDKFYAEMRFSWLFGWENINKDFNLSYPDKRLAMKAIKNHYMENQIAERKSIYHNVDLNDLQSAKIYE